MLRALPLCVFLLLLCASPTLGRYQPSNIFTLHDTCVRPNHARQTPRIPGGISHYFTQADEMLAKARVATKRIRELNDHPDLKTIRALKAAYNTFFLRPASKSSDNS